MSDYLKRRFPLERTDSVYMSGKQVFNLARWDKPGIIASVELFPADAETFRAEVWKAMREARTGTDDVKWLAREVLLERWHAFAEEGREDTPEGFVAEYVDALDQAGVFLGAELIAAWSK